MPNPALPLDEFLDQLREEAGDPHDSHFEAQRNGWRSPLWEFTRAAKAHPELAGLSAAAALQRVKLAMGSGGLRWVDFSARLENEAEGDMEFLSSWQTVKLPKGANVIDAAVRQAKEHPVKPRVPRGDGYGQFLSVACWLQEVVGDGDILLPCHRLAAALGCEAATVARYRRLALGDGLLRQVEPHRYVGRPGVGRATRFRFLPEGLAQDVIAERIPGGA